MYAAYIVYILAGDELCEGIWMKLYRLCNGPRHSVGSPRAYEPNIRQTCRQTHRDGTFHITLDSRQRSRPVDQIDDMVISRMCTTGIMVVVRTFDGKMWARAYAIRPAECFVGRMRNWVHGITITVFSIDLKSALLSAFQLFS